MMMDRSSARKRFYLVSWLALAAILTTSVGCVSAITGLAYLIKGNLVDAEYPGLKNKRVAIVCRPLVELQYSSGSVSGEIAQQLGVLLKQNVSRIEIIDPDKVADWTDEHTWDDFSEIGEALDADMIVGIDLQQFSMYQGQTLYQGKAKVTIKVYNIADGSKVSFQKTLPQIVYPPNTGIPTSEKPEEDFRRQFIVMLANEIGRIFYATDATLNFARDSTAL
jgi:hypothetical protein